MEELTEQSIFNQVYLGLKSQGFQRSMAVIEGNKNASCAYRGENGMKCALGHLISDEEYSPEMEGQTVYGLESLERLPKRLVPFVEFIGPLQAIHDDGIRSGEKMSKRLREFALERNLTVPKG